MTVEEVSKLRLGLYRLHWKSGGASWACVGQLHDGDKWFACANWTSSHIMGIASTQWELVERAEPIFIGSPNTTPFGVDYG